MQTPDLPPLKKVVFGDNYSLVMAQIPEGFKKNYGYVLTINNGRKSNTIKYEVDITYLKATPQRTRLFEIARTSIVFINDMEPDLLVDKLAYEVGSVFYPLKIEVNFDGSFLAVANPDEIRKRWYTRKGEITNYFKGEHADRYCQMMEKVIANDDRLNRALKNDYLIVTYFSPIYKSYTPQFAFTNIYGYPLIGKSTPVLFSIEQRVDEYLNELNGIELRHTGTAVDDRSADDLIHRRSFALSQSVDESIKPVSGQYVARYILNDRSKIIRAINAEWTLCLNNDLTIAVSLYETSQNQPSLTNRFNDDQSFLVMLDKEEPSKMKSFWKSLFS
jgi:hypothetical protein